MSTTPDADIYFTLDGSDPTFNSEKYNSPISISGHNKYVYVKAIAGRADRTLSLVTTAYYEIDYNFDRGSFIPHLSLPDVESKIVGTWIGYVSSPWNEPYNVEITFRNDGSYSGRTLSTTICARCEGIPNFYPALSFGTDEDHPGKIYDINDVRDDGKAVGKIDIVHEVGTRNRKTLSDIAFYDNYQVLTFSLLHNSHGNFEYTLVRKK